MIVALLKKENMKPVRAIVLAASVLYAVRSFAEQPSGLYLGPEVAFTRLEFEGSDYSKTQMTWGGLVGWQFNQILGAEFGYYRGSRISESTMVNGAAVAVDLKYSTTMVTVVGQYQINDRYSAFARLGAATPRQDSIGSIGSNAWILNDIRESHAVYGVGFSARTERARIRLEYRRTDIAFADSGAIALSLAWYISNNR